MATTRAAAEKAIGHTQDATCNGLVAVRISPDLYVVKSYGQLIAAVVRGRGYLVTTARYTPTTTGHTNLTRRAWQGLSVQDVTQDALDSAVRTA